ncbi:MAG TPA: hypothetical protein VGR73_14105 [Bryobacteraceae bacterium]|nr:hypothetical protein [Bryobacteraceae bacterium]
MIPAPINLVVSAVTIAIGIFFSAVPEQAAKLWGRRQLAQMANGPLYRRLYRVAGILLCVAGLLFVAESLRTLP